MGENFVVTDTKKIFFSTDVLFRVGGLSLNTMDFFKHKETIKVIGDILDITDRLELLKGTMDSALFEEIKNAENDEIRKVFINIKRDLKKDKVRNHAISVIHHLKQNNQMLLKELIDLLKVRKVHTEQIESLFNKEMKTIREHLQKNCNNEDFLKGILLSSENLFSKINSYISIPISEQNKKLRKIEKNLMVYISRIATKTSPFSTFTPVAFGQFTQDNNNCLVDDRKEKQSLIRINYIMVLYLIAAAEQHPEIKKDIPIKFNKEIKRHNNKINIFRSAFQIQEENPKVINYEESFVKLEMNQIIQAVESILDKNSKITFSLLVEQLENKFPSLIKEKIEVFINKLINIQLIQCKLNVPDNSEDILHDFVEELNLYCNSKVAEKLILYLKEMKGYVIQYGISVAQKRKVILNEIDDLFAKSCRLLGAEVKKIEPIIYEDTAYKGDFNLKLSDWKETKKYIAVLQKIVSLFSVNLPYSITFKEFFIRKYGVNGECEDVLEVLDEYGKFFKETFNNENDEYNPYNLELMNTVNELKSEFYHYIQNKIMNCDPVQLDINWLNEFSEKIPEEIRNTGSNSYFIQPFYNEENKLMVVLNRIASGYGQFMSRFEPLYSTTDDDTFIQNVQKNYKSILPKGHIFAELNGTFGFNGNVHKNMAVYEFSYPGINTNKRKEEKIPISDIVIRHSAEDKQLYFKSVSKDLYLHPLYLGFLTWYLLPPIYRMIFLMVPSTYFSMPLAREYYYNISQEKRDKSVIEIPRIQLGNIILSKRQWWIPKDKFNNIDDRSEVSLILSIELWRRKNGLPKEFFLHLIHDQKEYILQHSSNNEKNEDRDIFRKPQYIDLENIYLVKLLTKNISYCNRFFVIEEALPSSNDKFLNGTQGNYAAELIVELNQGR